MTCYCTLACDDYFRCSVAGIHFQFFLAILFVKQNRRTNKQNAYRGFCNQMIQNGVENMGQPPCLEKNQPNSISSTIATPWQSWRRTHRDQDLEGAVHDLDVPILQGTADHRDVGMAIQPFDARHWSLLPYTARTIFTPPWLVPGDVERQEFTVLKREVSKRSPFAVRKSDVLSDGGHIKSMENLKFLRSPPSRNASTDQNTFALYSWLKSISQAGFCGRNHFWGSPTALQQSYFTIQ